MLILIFIALYIVALLDTIVDALIIVTHNTYTNGNEDTHVHIQHTYEL